MKKLISRLSQVDGVDPDDIAEEENTSNHQTLFSDGEFDLQIELLRDLAKQLKKLKILCNRLS